MYAVLYDANVWKYIDLIVIDGFAWSEVRASKFFYSLTSPLVFNERNGKPRRDCWGKISDREQVVDEKCIVFHEKLIRNYCYGNRDIV